MNLDAIAATAAIVATEYETSREAIAERDTAEADLLSALVAKVLPALPAICSRVKSRHASWVASSRPSEIEYHDWRGLRVSGDGPSQGGDRRDGAGGPYEGEDLYLLSDGTFAEVTWGGHWSRWDKSCDELTSSVVRLDGTEHVAAHYEVEPIVSALSAALDKANGSREKVTKAARERAEKMRSLTSLLK